MLRPVCVLFALALCGAACERPEQRREAESRALAARVLQGVMVYPRSTLVSIAGGGEAAEVVLTTPAPVQEVATWYRQLLLLNGWELRSDALSKEGTISIYADSANRPLWITLTANAGGPGTTYTLIGAESVADSAQAQRSGSSMSSNRIQRR